MPISKASSSNTFSIIDLRSDNTKVRVRFFQSGVMDFAGRRYVILETFEDGRYIILVTLEDRRWVSFRFFLTHATVLVS